MEIKKDKKKKIEVKKVTNPIQIKKNKNQRQTLKLKDEILNTLNYEHDSNPIVPSPPITFFPQIQNKVHSVIERKCGGRPSNGCAWATIDD